MAGNPDDAGLTFGPTDARRRALRVSILIQVGITQLVKAGGEPAGDCLEQQPEIRNNAVSRPIAALFLRS